MAVLKTQLLLLFFVFKTIDDAYGVCTLSLLKDFGSPSPVFIKNNEFLTPDASGAISLKRSETIEIGCPGEKRLIVLGNYTSSYNVLEAHCIINSTFRVDRWTGPFKDIKCNRQPFFETQDTGRKCYNGAKVYNVGYQLRSKFYPTYEACFSSDLLSTHYVRHTLSPTSWFMQSGKRPDFIEGELFGAVKMSKLYKIEHQRHRLDDALGANMSSNFITKKQFLTRGHLAARADFTMRAESRASFHYVNAAPQWMRGNGGDWAALEDALRRRVKDLGHSVTVYTGTHSELLLPDKKHVSKPIYLYVDHNNNLQVPVPMYFYKLVYDPITKTATAFITINSSFYDKSTIQNLQFCSDVCDDNSNFSWLRWRSNDGTHSFCCDYDEFVEEVGYFNDLDVIGLFY